MQEKKLTAIDSSLSFFIGFLLTQISALLVMFIGYFICVIANIELDMLQPFFNTAFRYLLLVIPIDLVIFLIFSKRYTSVFLCTNNLRDVSETFRLFSKKR